MTNTQTIATHKIIIFIVFIIAAIMSSLFVFRMSHMQDPRLTSDEYSTIFPASRDIKDFDLVKTDGTPLTQKELRNHWSLVFFGFTHCPNVCPTTMSMLGKAYPELKEKYPDLQVILISLDPERDTKAVLSNYLSHFNKNFIGASGKINEIRKLQSQLGIYSTTENGELQHTSSLILINPQGKFAGLFKYGITSSDFINSFENNINKLTT